MPRTRKNRLDEIGADGDFDVVVLGGGVNGVGVYRELALQGLRVLLVERSDYASGCSSAPSRMIHGGLRYLENGEFSLVRESLVERDRLLENAPHMVRPLPTTVPIVDVFSGLWNAAVGFLGGDGQPARRGALPIRIGLGLYDWLTRARRTMPTHEFRGREATFAKWPALSRAVRFSATYYDAWISHPERLCLELIADAEKASPQSVALNYVTLASADDGTFSLLDREAGTRAPITARVIVNATGAWLDETKGRYSQSNEQLIAGTKGSHLIIDNPALLAALQGHMLYFENEDGRICIAFPYLGRVLAGATDIRVDGPTRVRCETDERDYILESLRRLLPDVETSEGDVVYSFSGIRPLPRSAHAFTGRISRGHFTRRIAGETPQICMVGGKWTTFRAFAEQTCDDVLRELNAARRCGSHDEPIGGGKDFPDDRNELAEAFMREFEIPRARADHLVDHYGTTGAAVQAYCDATPDDALLASGCAYTAREIDYLIRNEQVLHLCDLALRRTDLAITGALTEDIIVALVAIASDALNWSETDQEAERAALIDELREYHDVTISTDETDRRKECA